MRTACGTGLLISFLLASGANAQQIPPVQEIVDVTVANIEVVVVDRAGDHVRGLTRDDFELLEDGVPQRIANFVEFDEGAQPLGLAVEGEPPDLHGRAAEGGAPSAQPRRVIMFWDLATTAVMRGRELGAAIESLLEDLAPGDEVMIVSWDRILTIEVPPTQEIALARDGVRRIVKRAALDDFTWMNPCDPMYRKRAFDLLVEGHRLSAIALRTLIARIAPIRGRKVVILVSEGFGAQPGAEIAACAEPAVAIATPAESGKSQSEEVLRMTAESVHALDPLVESSRDLPESEELLASLVRTANSAGVTLYAVHSSGLIRPSPRPVIMDSGSLDAVEPKWQFVRRLNSIIGMRRLAEETGGVLAANTNDFKEAFHDISDDLGSYYSLGYRIIEAAREGDRRIEIRMRDPELIARTRRAVSVRSPEAEVSDAVRASLEFGDAANDLAIAAVAPPVTKAKRGRFSIPVEVRIPLEPLGFAQQEDRFVANVSIFVAATDPKKASSDVQRLDHAIEIAAGDFERIAGTYYTYRLDIDLRGRSAENRVAIAVLDQLTKITGFTVVKVGADAPGS